LSEKAVVVLVDQLAKSQQPILVAKASGTLDCIEQSTTSPAREAIPSLLSTEEEASECCVQVWTPQYEMQTYWSKGTVLVLTRTTTGSNKTQDVSLL